ncbi:MAG: ABC transporter substrate-binding protein, partial [Thermofilaceae archaeon]
RDVNFTWWFIKLNKPTQQYAKVFEELIETELPDDYTIIAYINGTSWTYLYDINVALVPAHIWGNESLLEQYGGWEKWDPSKVPHPTKSGLTCLIGTGPFIFADRKPGEYILLKWYAGYWKKHPAKTLTLEYTLQKTTLYEGDSLQITVKLTDYTGTALTNATVSLQLISDDNVVKSVSAAHKGGGVYEASLDTAGLSGSFKALVRSSAVIAGTSFEKEVPVSITIRPAWERYLPYIALGAIGIAVVIIAVLYLTRRKKSKSSG